MPKKKVEESAEEQARRFEAEVQRLVGAGELDPTEADERFEKVLKHLASKRSQHES